MYVYVCIYVQCSWVAERLSEKLKALWPKLLVYEALWPQAECFCIAQTL